MTNTSALGYNILAAAAAASASGAKRNKWADMQEHMYETQKKQKHSHSESQHKQGSSLASDQGKKKGSSDKEAGSTAVGGKGGTSLSRKKSTKA